MKILALTSLLLLGAALVSLACTSPASQEAPYPTDSPVVKGINEPTLNPDRPRPTMTNTLTPEEMPQGVSRSQAQDARTYAEQHDSKLLITRLLMQDTVEELENLLYRKSDTFGGLWVQHEPEYRVIVAFTKDGEETIARYV